MAKGEPPKFTADGVPDGRGHADGSKDTRFKADDGRARPGRPKKSRDERTIVQTIREMKVTVNEGGRRRRINTLEAVLLTMRKKAVAGDVKAAEMLLKRFDRYEVPTAEPDRTRELLAEDRLILEAAAARRLLPGPGFGGTGGDEA